MNGKIFGKLPSSAFIDIELLNSKPEYDELNGFNKSHTHFVELLCDKEGAETLRQSFLAKRMFDNFRLEYEEKGGKTIWEHDAFIASLKIEKSGDRYRVIMEMIVWEAKKIK